MSWLALIMPVLSDLWSETLQKCWPQQGISGFHRKWEDCILWVAINLMACKLFELAFYGFLSPHFRVSIVHVSLDVPCVMVNTDYTMEVFWPATSLYCMVWHYVMALGSTDIMYLSSCAQSNLVCCVYVCVEVNPSHNAHVQDFFVLFRFLWACSLSKVLFLTITIIYIHKLCHVRNDSQMIHEPNFWIEILSPPLLPPPPPPTLK